MNNKPIIYKAKPSKTLFNEEHEELQLTTYTYKIHKENRRMKIYKYYYWNVLSDFVVVFTF